MVEVKERSGTQSRGLKANSMVHPIRKIGIVGAGQMGNGIAHVCALSGYDVLLNDLATDRISAGLATINGNLARQVSRQRINDEERQAAIKRIGRQHARRSAIAIWSSKLRPSRKRPSARFSPRSVRR